MKSHAVVRSSSNKKNIKRVYIVPLNKVEQKASTKIIKNPPLIEPAFKNFIRQQQQSKISDKQSKKSQLSEITSRKKIQDPNIQNFHVLQRKIVEPKLYKKIIVENKDNKSQNPRLSQQQKYIKQKNGKEQYHTQAKIYFQKPNIDQNFYHNLNNQQIQKTQKKLQNETHIIKRKIIPSVKNQKSMYHQNQLNKSIQNLYLNHKQQQKSQTFVHFQRPTYNLSYNYQQQPIPTYVQSLVLEKQYYDIDQQLNKKNKKLIKKFQVNNKQKNHILQLKGSQELNSQQYEIQLQKTGNKHKKNINQNQIGKQFLQNSKLQQTPRKIAEDVNIPRQQFQYQDHNNFNLRKQNKFTPNKNNISKKGSLFLNIEVYSFPRILPQLYCKHS